MSPHRLDSYYSGHHNCLPPGRNETGQGHRPPRRASAAMRLRWHKKNGLAAAPATMRLPLHALTCSKTAKCWMQGCLSVCGQASSLTLWARCLTRLLAGRWMKKDWTPASEAPLAKVLPLPAAPSWAKTVLAWEHNCPAHRAEMAARAAAGAEAPWEALARPAAASVVAVALRTAPLTRTLSVHSNKAVAAALLRVHSSCLMVAPEEAPWQPGRRMP